MGQPRARLFNIISRNRDRLKTNICYDVQLISSDVNLTTCLIFIPRPRLCNLWRPSQNTSPSVNRSTVVDSEPLITNTILYQKHGRFYYITISAPRTTVSVLSILSKQPLLVDVLIIPSIDIISTSREAGAQRSVGHTSTYLIPCRGIRHRPMFQACIRRIAKV